MSDTAALLIQILREQCLRRGLGGIRGLGVVFRTMDLDCSRSIVMEELKIGLQRFGLRMADSYLKTLFDSMDSDKNGKIDFLEFMKALRLPLNNKRIDVINEAFDKLDINHDGVLDVDDLKGLYCIFVTFDKNLNWVVFFGVFVIYKSIVTENMGW